MSKITGNRAAARLSTLSMHLAANQVAKTEQDNKKPFISTEIIVVDGHTYAEIIDFNKDI